MFATRRRGPPHHAPAFAGGKPYPSLIANDLAVQRELDPSDLRGLVRLGRQLDAEFHDARHRLRNLLDLGEFVPRRAFVGPRVSAKGAPEGRNAKIVARQLLHPETPLFQTAFDFSPQLEEVLAVALVALAVRFFAPRVR